MKPLFWLDLEMTGLDEKTHKIIEVAVVITDLDFKPLEEYHRVVFQPQNELDKMDSWCQKTHGDSGLTAAVPKGTPIETVEKELLELVGRHYGPNDRVVLVGNSIWNDRRFIEAYLPEFTKRLHYRMIDISSYKEIFRDKYKVEFKKGNAHRAVEDIHESIRELSLYLSYFKAGEKE